MNSEKRILLNIRLHLNEKLQEGERLVIPAIRAISGLWRIMTPIQADEGNDDNELYWQASVYLPQNTEFEWRWVIYKDNHIVDIEKDYRRCKVGRFGGVIHTSWDSEVKILEPDMCVVSFYTRYQTLPDERLAIVGSSDPLGRWVSSKAVPAYEHPPGEWSVSIALEKDTSQEWKWVLLDMNHDYIRRWEDRPNRVLECESFSWRSVWAPWNGGNYFTGSGSWEKLEWSALRLPADILNDSFDTSSGNNC
ncbi:hypothetical protein SNE40_011610 [Patella caerulea]|uniref:CBM20 domain-containing protein n=1 Tax=Patella caerulea TaxID=87958 RepID=A0AAN8JQA2_PATCE